jgi:hypothetical protein
MIAAAAYASSYRPSGAAVGSPVVFTTRNPVSVTRYVGGTSPGPDDVPDAEPPVVEPPDVPPPVTDVTVRCVAVDPPTTVDPVPPVVPEVLVPPVDPLDVLVVTMPVAVVVGLASTALTGAGAV